MYPLSVVSNVQKSTQKASSLLFSTLTCSMCVIPVALGFTIESEDIGTDLQKHNSYHNSGMSSHSVHHQEAKISTKK